MLAGTSYHDTVLLPNRPSSGGLGKGCSAACHTCHLNISSQWCVSFLGLRSRSHFSLALVPGLCPVHIPLLLCMEWWPHILSQHGDQEDGRSLSPSVLTSFLITSECRLIFFSGMFAMQISTLCLNSGAAFWVVRRLPSMSKEDSAFHFHYCQTIQTI